jgi:hypothetical protein
MKKFIGALMLALMLAGNCLAQDLDWPDLDRWQDELNQQNWVDQSGKYRVQDAWGLLPYAGFDLWDGTWRIVKIEDGSLYATIDKKGNVYLPDGALAFRVTRDGTIYDSQNQDHWLNELHRKMFGGKASDALKEFGGKLDDAGNAVVKKSIVVAKDAASAVGNGISKSAEAVGGAVKSVGGVIEKPIAAVGGVISTAWVVMKVAFWIVLGAIAAFVCLYMMEYVSRMMGSVANVRAEVGRLITRKEGECHGVRGAFCDLLRDLLRDRPNGEGTAEEGGGASGEKCAAARANNHPGASKDERKGDFDRGQDRP